MWGLVLLHRLPDVLSYCQLPVGLRCLHEAAHTGSQHVQCIGMETLRPCFAAEHSLMARIPAAAGVPEDDGGGAEGTADVCHRRHAAPGRRDQVAAEEEGCL